VIHRLCLALLYVLPAVTGCGGDTLSPVARTALVSRITLAHVAVESSRTVPAIVADGQLFCEADGHVFAVLAADAEPSSVTGQPAAAVARACAVVGPNGVPVPPPSDPANVPSVVPVQPIMPPAR